MYIICISVEDQKTIQQKEREAQLLQQLIELVDEKDKLERGKLTAERRYYNYQSLL